MPPRLRQCSLKLLAAFFISLSVLVAQNPTKYMTPGVMRVGEKLACRCGTCRSTIASCPMLRCESSAPGRKRIYEMQQRGMSDDAIVSAFVKEGGVAALAAPPAEGFEGILTWVMPPIALALGFLIYSWFVRKHRAAAAPLTPQDEAMIERYRTQMERELGEAPEEDRKV